MMYNVSRKTFLSISKIIDWEKDSMGKSEEICELIENEINNSVPKTFEKQIPVAGVQTAIGDSSTDVETPEQRLMRFKKMEAAWMGQVNKKGEFVPLSIKMNLAKDAKERE